MTPFASVVHRLHWLNLPGALLIALLQRTPILRVLATGAEHLAASPAGQVMRSVFTLGALGALHGRAGATTFVISSRSPISATVGTPIQDIAFTYTGTPAAPASFQVTGALPPGLAFVPPPINGTVRSGNPRITGTPTQAGTFTVLVQGFSALGNTNNVRQPIVFNVTGGEPTAIAPAFSVQPASQSVLAGSTVLLSATATGTPTPAYQWQRNGSVLPGATTATLSLSAVQPADSGNYSVVATNSAGSVASAIATLTVIATDADARLTNLSVRTTLAAGQPLIVGVVVSGGARDILVRAAGPALTAFGLGSAMADPRLELYNDKASLVFSNNDWGTGPASLASTFASVGAFAFVSGSRDAAFVQNLNAAYSVQAQGAGSGVVLVEAYDTGTPTAARLINVSARNRVGTGDDILIAGFNISGTGAKALLIRAVGPKLGAFGVTGFLADPKLEVFNSSGALVAENDTWTLSLAATFGSVGAFALDAGSRDAALLASLAPGSYTVQVRGADGGTGEALIEIYEVR